MDMLDNKKSTNIWPLISLRTGFFLFFAFSLMVCLIGYAFAQGGKAAKKAAPEGNVSNLYGKAIGSVDAEGVVTNLYGRPVGSVDSNGNIFNVSKIAIGRVGADGKVSNQTGTVLFSVDIDGNIHNVSGRKVGEVKDVKDIKLIGGVARLLFIR
ncbi:5-fold beta-flower protein [Thermodesulfobacteriota bacterium]